MEEHRGSSGSGAPAGGRRRRVAGRLAVAQAAQPAHAGRLLLFLGAQGAARASSRIILSSSPQPAPCCFDATPSMPPGGWTRRSGPPGSRTWTSHRRLRERRRDDPLLARRHLPAWPRRFRTPPRLRPLPARVLRQPGPVRPQAPRPWRRASAALPCWLVRRCSAFCCCRFAVRSEPATVETPSPDWLA